MIVKELSADGSIQVEYDRTHSNHELEMKYLTLNDAEKENKVGT